MSEPGGLPQAWLQWLRDYSVVAGRFVTEDPVTVSGEEERELVAIKSALFARALTLFDSAVLLIENDRQLDFRMHSRGVIEATMYLIALDRNPSFVTKMKDDDFKSRHARASLHLNARDLAADEDVRRMLEEFVVQGSQGAKAINMSTLLEGTQFDRLYRTFRDMSGDAAHASITALNRHYVPHPANGLAMLMLHPELDDFEMRATVAELGISITIATMILMKTKEKTDTWDDLQSLLAGYRELTRDNRASNPS